MICSSALYPLWRVRETNEVLFQLASWNPFNQGVELIRHALYLELNAVAAAYCVLALLAFMALAISAYNPARGMLASKGGGPPGG